MDNSFTLTLLETSSTLDGTVLSTHGTHSFQELTFRTIRNIDVDGNKLYVGNNLLVTVSAGNYEIDYIQGRVGQNCYLHNNFKQRIKDKKIVFVIRRFE